MLMNKGMRQRIQTVVSQKPQQIGHCRLAVDRCAGMGEKLPSRLTVEHSSQLYHLVFNQRIVVEKNIRALKSHKKKLSEITDDPPVFRRQPVGSHLAETIMSIACWHMRTSKKDKIILHDFYRHG
jgi:hypothetical protein